MIMHVVMFYYIHIMEEIMTGVLVYVQLYVEVHLMLHPGTDDLHPLPP